MKLIRSALQSNEPTVAIVIIAIIGNYMVTAVAVVTTPVNYSL